MSPPTQFGFAASRSAGERTTRPIVAEPRFSTCRPSRSTMRSAYASRSSSVQRRRRASSSPAASPFGRRRQLLQLEPEDARALRCARRVDRQRLAADDRRLRRQQPALGLVDGARDAVEARCHVHDRRPRKPLVAVPAWALVHRDVDLHLAAAVAEAPGRIANVRPAPRRRRAATRRAASASHTRSPPALLRSSRRRRAARRRAPAVDEDPLDAAPRSGARRRRPARSPRARRRAGHRRPSAQACRRAAARTRSPAS